MAQRDPFWKERLGHSGTGCSTAGNKGGLCLRGRERKLLGRRQTATSQMVRPEQAGWLSFPPARKTMTRQGGRDRESQVRKSRWQWALAWDRCHLSYGTVPWAEEWGQGRGSGKFRSSGPSASSRARWETQNMLDQPGPAAGGGGASAP